MRVLFLGDTHGNPDWWWRHVAPTVTTNRPDLVIQVGDFGWWPHTQVFIDATRTCPVPVWFIDGNHEHWPSLKNTVARTGPASDGTVPLGGNLSYVPRGTITSLGASRTLFCGGAHSIDRQVRTKGMDWWPDEDVTDDDVTTCSSHGKVDVLICHDAPNRWAVPGIHDHVAMPTVWKNELDACNRGRQQITRIFDAAEPRLFVHGHYHVGYTRRIDTGWGDLTVIGLHRDDHPDAFAVVDFDDTQATWTTPTSPGGTPVDQPG